MYDPLVLMHWLSLGQIAVILLSEHSSTSAMNSHDLVCMMNYDLISFIEVIPRIVMNIMMISGHVGGY